MAIELNIHCPNHDVDETINLSDTYQNFEGEIYCGGGAKITLIVKIVDGRLASLYQPAILAQLPPRVDNNISIYCRPEDSLSTQAFRLVPADNPLP